jgi:hypothetical protein
MPGCTHWTVAVIILEQELKEAKAAVTFDFRARPLLPIRILVGKYDFVEL